MINSLPVHKIERHGRNLDEIAQRCLLSFPGLLFTIIFSSFMKISSNRIAISNNVIFVYETGNSTFSIYVCMYKVLIGIYQWPSI